MSRSSISSVPLTRKERDSKIAFIEMNKVSVSCLLYGDRHT